jgi:hypothetical protein
VVFLDIGTNDVNRGAAPGPAATQLENLVNSIFLHDPGVTILVGGLIPVPDPTIAANMRAFNSAVSSWIAQNPNGANGGHVAFVDMSHVGVNDLPDGLHPSDRGYEKMATAWFMALTVADIDHGWINSANAPGDGCSADWSPNWQGRGTIALGPPSTALPLPGNLVTGLGDQVTFADMNGDMRDDLAIIGASDGALTVWLNGGQSSSGTVNWNALGTVFNSVGHSGSQI